MMIIILGLDSVDVWKKVIDTYVMATWCISYHKLLSALERYFKYYRPNLFYF